MKTITTRDGEIKEIKTLRKELMQHALGIPNREVAPGIIFKKAGYKYITLSSLWGSAHKIKCCYACYVNGGWGSCIYCQHV